MDREMNTPQLKLTEISVPDLVKLLKRAGWRFASEDAIKSDIDMGAPINVDGTINLIHYTAWLIKELGRDGN